jgi:hypothetical protein
LYGTRTEHYGHPGRKQQSHYVERWGYLVGYLTVLPCSNSCCYLGAKYFCISKGISLISGNLQKTAIKLRVEEDVYGRIWVETRARRSPREIACCIILDRPIQYHSPSNGIHSDQISSEIDLEYQKRSVFTLYCKQCISYDSAGIERFQCGNWIEVGSALSISDGDAQPYR